MEKKTSTSSVTDAIMALRDEGVQAIGHFGILPPTGNRKQSWWSIYSGDSAIARLMENPDYKVAQILSVLGSEARLGILRILFQEPKTAAELVAEMKFGTTGQAYHHLRELERAGYIEQREGRWHFQMKVGRVYLTALALAADAGAGRSDEDDDETISVRAEPPI